MADLSKTIAIIFSGVDELSGPIDTVMNKLDGFSDHIESIAAPLSDAADGIIAVDTAITALAVGAIGLAVKEAGEFNASVSEINTLLKLNSGELDNYSAEIQSYAQNSTQSLDQITTALYNAASLGVEYSDSLDVLAAAEKLAVGSKAELNSALETLIGTMNAYGAPMSEITNYSDAFFTIVKDGKTTLPELATSIADVTGIAASAGVDFDTLGAAIAAMTASGAPTSQAITKIKAAIEALLAPTPAAAEAAKALGINIGEAALKAEGFPAVLQDIYEKTGGSAQAMGDIIPSIEGLQGALILGADKSGIFAQALEDMANKTGATTDAFNEMADNSDLIWQNMINNWEVMLVKFGDALESNSNDLVGSFAELWQAISEGVDAGSFDPLLDMINDFASKAGDLISQVAKNLPEAFEQVDFSGLINSLGMISDSIGGLFENVDLDTPDGLAEVIQFVVDSLDTLATVTSGMIDQFKPFVESIVGLVSSFNEMDDASKVSAGEILALAKQVTAAGLEIAAAILVIGDYADKLGPVFDVVVNTVSGAFDGVVVIWNGLKMAFFEIIDDLLAASLLFSESLLFGAFSEDIEANIAVIQQWKDETQANMSEAADSAIEKLTGIQTNFAGLGEAADAAAEDTKDVGTEVEKLPDEKTTAVAVDADQESIDTTKTEIANAAPESVTTDAKVEPDQPSIDTTKTEIANAAPESVTTDAKVEPDVKSLSSTKSAIDDAVPESKIMEIQLQGEIGKELEQIKADAETLQTAFEWTAKLNIAQIEADAEVAVAAFEGIADSVAATAEATASMFGSLLDNWDQLNWVEKKVFEQILMEQMAMERAALQTQIALTEAQIAYMEAKTQAMAQGEGLIKIEADGLVPHVKAFMMTMLEEIQMTVSEEASEFLLGLGVI